MRAVELIHVTPHVLCVHRPFYLSNSYVVHGDGKAILVDAGMRSDGAEMMFALESVGLSVRSVHAILLTHWHNDHSSGAETIRQASEATVYYHRDEAPHFSQTAVGRVRRRVSSLIPEYGPFAALKAVIGSAPPRAIAVAQTLEGDGEIDGDFQYLSTPGHTAGHISYYFRPDRVLFPGDALAVCGGRLWFMSRFLTEDLTLAYDSMLKVARIDARHVCPGHRGPLSSDVDRHRGALVRHLEQGKRWPLLS